MSQQESVTREREEFEAWAHSEGLNTEKCLNGEYFYTHTRRTWFAWQAGAEQAIASADERCNCFQPTNCVTYAESAVTGRCVYCGHKPECHTRGNDGR